jgi:hypothetical protein
VVLIFWINLTGGELHANIPAWHQNFMKSLCPGVAASVYSLLLQCEIQPGYPRHEVGRV